MEKKHYLERFRQMNRDDYIALGFFGLTLALLLYFSISFSVKLSLGYTLFGDSSQYKNTLEEVGPTSADISVLILFWVLTAILLVVFVYVGFIRKIGHPKVVKKEIINGKTVIIKEEKENDSK